MVNKIIYNYLKSYSGKYKLEDLKQKILSKDYNEEDIEEAVQILGLDKERKTFEENKKGFKLMKFAGIIGALFLILILGGFIYSLYLEPSKIQKLNLKPSAEQISKSAINIYLAVFFVISFLSLFFVKGFFRMGKYAESRILKFSSRILIFLNILFLILIFCGFVITNVWFDSFVNFINQQKTASTFIGISVFLILALLFILIFLFFIGLILAGSKIRFSRIAGILGSLLIISLIAFFLALFFNPVIWVNWLLSGYFPIIFSIVNAVICISLILILLFEVLALFNASKKFE